jgi:hypothetical protein
MLCSSIKESSINGAGFQDQLSIWWMKSTKCFQASTFLSTRKTCEITSNQLVSKMETTVPRTKETNI